ALWPAAKHSPSGRREREAACCGTDDPALLPSVAIVSSLRVSALASAVRHRPAIPVRRNYVAWFILRLEKACSGVLRSTRARVRGCQFHFGYSDQTVLPPTMVRTARPLSSRAWKGLLR